jgi:hypothetical protein
MGAISALEGKLESTMNEMRGPFTLSVPSLNMIAPLTRVCVYCLSNLRDSVQVIRRSEQGIRAELRKHVGQYKYFWLAPAISPREAFNIECDAWHRNARQTPSDLGHPLPASGTDWVCPHCQKQH